MAIALNGGHVARAIEFLHTVGKYFIIGGTTPWLDETNPDIPNIEDFKLLDVVGLKKVESNNISLVVPDPEGSIQYKGQNWRKVEEEVKTTVGSSGVTAGSKVVSVESVGGLTMRSKVRINNLYEGTIQSISGNLLTLDTEAPEDIPAGSVVLAGAIVEDAKYVYLTCYLNYDEFPVVTYRQVGLCSRVEPNDKNTLLSAGYDGRTKDDYTSLGVLEILDNRVPSTRDENQREQLSMIIEF